MIAIRICLSANWCAARNIGCWLLTTITPAQSRGESRSGVKATGYLPLEIRLKRILSPQSISGHVFCPSFADDSGRLHCYLGTSRWTRNPLSQLCNVTPYIRSSALVWFDKPAFRRCISRGGCCWFSRGKCGTPKKLSGAGKWNMHRGRVRTPMIRVLADTRR